MSLGIWILWFQIQGSDEERNYVSVGHWCTGGKCIHKYGWALLRREYGVKRGPKTEDYNIPNFNGQTEENQMMK